MGGDKNRLADHTPKVWLGRYSCPVSEHQIKNRWTELLFTFFRYQFVEFKARERERAIAAQHSMVKGLISVKCLSQKQIQVFWTPTLSKLQDAEANRIICCISVEIRREVRATEHQRRVYLCVCLAWWACMCNSFVLCLCKRAWARHVDRFS